MNHLETLEAQSATIDQFCTELAKTFRVRTHEVAVYGLRSGMLRFLHPTDLRHAGAIPTTSSTLAGRTASSKRPEFHNNLSTVRHSSVFETVSLSQAEGIEQAALTIQKILSAPITASGGDVVGVIQISRKGLTLSAAGPDFTHEDVRSLEQASQVFGRMMPKFMSVL